MAGDIKRQRKSWTLQDRSKVSINILRANLAEEGDEDAQLDVAKRLLQESSDTEVPEKSRKENARLALYWLIKSSEQGNDEATQLLKECLQSGSGLTAQNILDVRTCITTPKYEKLTFKAARLIHRKLSNGEEFITTAQLLAQTNAKKGKTGVAFEGCPNGAVVQEEMLLEEEENAEEMLEEQQNVHPEKVENSTNASSSQTKGALMKDADLNETFIVSSQVSGRSAASSAQSTSPKQKPQRSPLQNQPQQMELDELPVPQLDLQLAMMQPGKKLTLSDLLNVAKDFNVGRTPRISLNERSKILSRHQWNVNSFPNVFIAQLLILALLGNLIHVKLALSYVVLLGVVWSCYNCFLWKLRYRNFKDWKLAFQSVLTEEWKLDKLKMRQSIHYVIPHVIIFSLGPLLLPLFNEDQVYVILVSVGITVIISIQYGLRQKLLISWRHLLVLSTTLVYYKCSFIINLMRESFKEQADLLHQPMFQIGDSDQLKYFPLPIDVFTLLIFGILCTSLKLSFHKILKETIPDVVLTLWLIKVVQWFVTVENSDFFLGVCLGIVVCGLMMLLCSHLETWKVVLVVVSGMILVVSLLAAVSTHQEIAGSNEQGFENKVQFVEWEDYEASCHRKAWNVQSPAATQIKCSNMYGDHINNMLVKWKGRISIVKVENLSRSPRDTESLEDVVFDISVGIFPSHKDDGSRNWQNFLSGSSDTEIMAPASIIVKTMNIRDKKQKQNVIDHILNLRTGDKIEFVGKLKGSSAGSLKPQIVDVQSIQCLSCTTADYEEFAIEQHGSTMHSISWLKNAIMEIPMRVRSSGLFENSKNYLCRLFSTLHNSSNI